MTDDRYYVKATHEWVLRMPIGLGMCPWAIKSNNKGLLNIITCTSDTASNVTDIVKREIESFANNEGTPPLSTTLIVCPYVKEWKDFKSFDEYIKFGIKDQLKNDTILEDATLVAFHPKFCRWYGLPPNIGIGSVVQSHHGIVGQKSIQTATATIIETNNKAFGLRKVKVRFIIIMQKKTVVLIDWNNMCQPIGWSSPRNNNNNVQQDQYYPIIVCINLHIQRYILLIIKIWDHYVHGMFHV